MVRTERRKIVRIGLMSVLVAGLTGLLLLIFIDHPVRAENVRTVSQLQEYIKALELIRADTGSYPGPSEFVCLGDYTDDHCWGTYGTDIEEDEVLNEALRTYLPILPAGPLIESDVSDKENREGYIYRQFNNGRSFEIQYILEGTDRECGVGEENGAIVEGFPHYDNTWCHIIR